MTNPDQNPMPNIVAVDPLAYLAERVKRGADFVRVVKAAGRVTEECLSEHNRGGGPMLDEAIVD